ncbi:at hook domain-containing protein [Ophiostoma piceae UAMH 11346]|uniref:At hook domain-containing protein n=1 Tax=Ophiostoma piceae (strain UAMH 11346) TaxID=1262450 RepID=S3D995_OPHP1|nr:at hook domain-containing protein [Ophiostoma piceae UAMH 11346]
MDEPDELSPDQPVPATGKERVSRSAQARQASEVPSSSPVTRVAKRMPPQKTLRVKSKQNTISTVDEEPGSEPEPEQEPEQEEEEENGEAEEIDAVEAARTIGKKRPRRSTVHEPSPELGSQPTESQPAASPEEDNRANKRRRQRDQDQSPSAQSQLRPTKKSSTKASKRASSSSASKTTATAKKQRKKKRKRSDDADSGNDEDELEGAGKGSRSRGAPVPITVQRFSKIRMAAVRRSHSGDGSDEDDDELAAGGDLPFSNRSGVNAVDVLAQISEDIVEQKLLQLQEKHQQVRQQAAEEGGDGGAAAISAVRKDIQAARRALQSFQQELRTRLLEQAVAVDTLYAMRKRVRAVHKEKLALREEILRIRAERDQVGLRMDALRTQHQQRVGQAMQATQISSTMFDIELAVEQGRAAPELTPAQQKTAELANLELVVRRIASQVSGGCRDTTASGNKGGTLNQIMEFNAFLERTAAVLEGRRLPAKAVLA